MFKEKRYDWNYLFKELFKWHSQVNEPELFAELSEKKASKAEIRKGLSNRFFSYLMIVPHKLETLLYLFCVESIGVGDKENPLGLFRYFQAWKLSVKMIQYSEI